MKSDRTNGNGVGMPRNEKDRGVTPDRERNAACCLDCGRGTTLEARCCEEKKGVEGLEATPGFTCGAAPCLE